MAGYGSGSIFLRSDGRTIVKYKGRQYSCKSRTAAENKLRELRKEKSLPAQSEAKCIPKQELKNLMEEWLYGVVKANLSPASFDRKENTCRYQVFPYIGDIETSSLTPDIMERMLLELADEGFSYSTMKKAFDAVNQCLNYNVEKGNLEYNPICGVKVPRRDKKNSSDIVFYSEAELNAIYKEALRTCGNGARAHKHGEAIVLLASTGMRVGELLALSWSDIDLERRVIYVRGTRVSYKNRDAEANKKYITADQPRTKTASGARDVPMNKRTFSTFMKLAKKKKGEKVFISDRGNPVSATEINRTFKSILTNCGFPKNKFYGVHSLRHTFASLLISKGGEIKKVSSILGHKNIYITYNTYIHFVKADLHDTVNLLN